MIARLWSGRSTSVKADTYSRHFITTVVPGLKTIAGHQGAYLMRRERDGQVEFLALTLWDSIETVKKFTGPDPEIAIVEPEGRAGLTEVDEFATHYDVALVAVRNT